MNRRFQRPVLTVVLLLDLDGWPHPDLAVQTSVVPRVDVLEQGDFGGCSKVRHGPRRLMHCPWQNGKVERFNRTLQIEWAYRQVFVSNTERSHAPAPWLENYNTRRRHTALGDQPPISRVESPT